MHRSIYRVTSRQSRYAVYFFTFWRSFWKILVRVLKMESKTVISNAYFSMREKLFVKSNFASLTKRLESFFQSMTEQHTDQLNCPLIGCTLFFPRSAKIGSWSVRISLSGQVILPFNTFMILYGGKGNFTRASILRIYNFVPILSPFVVLQPILWGIM